MCAVAIFWAGSPLMIYGTAGPARGGELRDQPTILVSLLVACQLQLPLHHCCCYCCQGVDKLSLLYWRIVFSVLTSHSLCVCLSVCLLLTPQRSAICLATWTLSHLTVVTMAQSVRLLS
jgi:hypothetical protein